MTVIAKIGAGEHVELPIPNEVSDALEKARSQKRAAKIAFKITWSNESRNRTWERVEIIHYAPATEQSAEQITIEHGEVHECG